MSNFVTEMCIYVNISITIFCTVGYFHALWNLWDRSTGRVVGSIAGAFYVGNKRLT